MTEQRVGHLADVRVTRSGRKFLSWFLMLVLISLLGIAWYILPFVTIDVLPKIEFVPVSVDIKVDTSLTEPLLAVNSIPGRVVVDTEVGQLQENGFDSFTVERTTIAFDRAHVSSLVQKKVNETLKSDFIQVNEPLAYTLSQPVGSATQKGAYVVVAKVNVRAFRPLSIKSIETRLLGSSYSEVEQILRAQKGVSEVLFNVYPYFFAKISQNMPRSSSSLTIRLDVDGKTSILK